MTVLRTHAGTTYRVTIIKGQVADVEMINESHLAGNPQRYGPASRNNALRY